MYIHGMGGGSDSRIPSILRECFDFSSSAIGQEVEVVCRTYDFDPEIAASQITSWVNEVRPDVIVAESLGSLHGLRIPNVPLVFVSPALNTSYYFEVLAWLSLIPGVTMIFDRIYRPREGDRQPLHFTFRTLRKYRAHRKVALANKNHLGPVYAFFGTDDHYKKSGIVSIKTWKKHFGDTFSVYKGTHFMEEEFVRSILYEKISSLLDTNK